METDQIKKSIEDLRKDFMMFFQSYLNQIEKKDEEEDEEEEPDEQLEAIQTELEKLNEVIEILANKEQPAPVVEVTSPEVKPIVNVPAPIVRVTEQTLDIKPITLRLDALLAKENEKESKLINDEDQKTLKELIDRLDKFTKTKSPVPLARGGGISGKFTTTTPDSDATGLIVRNIPSGTQDVHFADTSVTGVLDALNDYVEIVTDAMGTGMFQVSGTWSGRIKAQGAVDGTWMDLVIVDVNGDRMLNGINNDNQNGMYHFLGGAGHTKVRLAMTSFSSGSATVIMNASSVVDHITVFQPSEANLLATAYQGGSWSANLDTSLLSAFGSLETAELTPIIQGDWVYGINTQLWNTPTKSGTGADVDTNGSRLRIQSGTATNGYAYITSRRPVRYRAGQGTLARFTPVFGTAKEDSVQLWGLGTIASNAPSDGYFFGYNNRIFGIAHYIAGSPTWTAQSDFNGDTLDGLGDSGITWTPTFGTPVQIKYPYLGYGDIFFYVQNPTTGRWILAHTIRYANTTAAVQLSNPTLNFIGYVKNSGNTTNITMYSGSVGVFVSGTRSFVGNPKWAIDNAKVNPTAETSIIGLRNCTTFNSVTNRGLIRLNSLSVAMGGAVAFAYGTIRLRINATLSGSPSYTPISGSTADSCVTITSGNSITGYDVAATGSSAGTLIYNTTIPNNGNMFIDLTPFELFVAPTEVLTIAGIVSANSTLSVAVNWSEDI